MTSTDLLLFYLSIAIALLAVAVAGYAARSNLRKKR